MLIRLTFKCKIENFVLVMSLKYTSVTQSILCLIVGQESKKQFAVYDSDTPVTLKQGQIIKPGMNWKTQSKVIILQSLKNLARTVSLKKANIKLLSNQKTCKLSPLSMCKSQKIVVHS